MNGWTAALFTIVLAANPAAIGLIWRRYLPAERDRVLALAGVGTLALVLFAWLSGPLLNLLDVTTPTYRLGAAAVLGFTGIRWLVAPGGSGPDELPDGPLGTALLMLPLLTPAPVLVAIAAGADAGVAAALVGALISLVAVAVVVLFLTGGAGPSDARTTVLVGLARLIAAAAVLVAVLMALDAARTV